MAEYKPMPPAATLQPLVEQLAKHMFGEDAFAFSTGKMGFCLLAIPLDDPLATRAVSNLELYSLCNVLRECLSVIETQRFRHGDLEIRPEPSGTWTIDGVSDWGGR